MRKLSMTWMTLMTAAILTAQSEPVAAGDGCGSCVSSCMNCLTGIAKKLHIGSVDLSSYECDGCGQIHGAKQECVKRTPITKCVVGKQKCEECQIKYEYVSIPEVRYRWRTMWITKEIPADGCKPVCKSQDSTHCYGVEKWGKPEPGCGDGCGPAAKADCGAPAACAAGCGDDGCGGCGDGACPGEVQCRTIEPKTEKAECKYCDYEPGKTTIKVRYLSCVKEPYTVYRQVKKPICVKHCRYEKVEVPITKCKCEKVSADECGACDGAGGKACGQGCGK